MYIKLYKPYPGIREEKMTPIEVSISGKIGNHIQVYFDEGYSVEIMDNEFHCEKDNTYQGVFEKINLNYKFKFYHKEADRYDDSLLTKSKWYAYLNFYNRMKIEWLFKRNWLQQNQNIKWILVFTVTCIMGIVSFLNK